VLILKVFRIKKSREFQEISKKNIKYISKTLLVLSAPTPEFYLLNQKSPRAKVTDFCRFGQTVSKKIGNAVVRNKAKRRIRAAMLDISRSSLDKANQKFPQESSQKGYLINNQDYIIIAKKEIKDADYQDILSDLKFCLKGITRLLNNSVK
jgi:ribonuclease P protein component